MTTNGRCPCAVHDCVQRVAALQRESVLTNEWMQRARQAEAMLEAQRTEGASQTVDDLVARLREVEATLAIRNNSLESTARLLATLTEQRQQAEHTAAVLASLLREAQEAFRANLAYATYKDEQIMLAVFKKIDAALAPSGGCPDCGESPMDGHSPDCPSALTPSAAPGEGETR